MNTAKPFATISYNSKEFLKTQLDQMMEDKTLEFYCFISHLPEEDERKEHIHLFVIPMYKMDTEDFRDRLVEPIPGDLPRRCLPCVSSKFVDWYLYGLHDRDYLAMKMETRKYKYQREEMVTPDYEYFIQLIHRCDFSKWKRQRRFKEMVESGETFDSLCSNGFIPAQLIYQYQKLYQSMLDNKYNYFNFDRTDRGDKVGHD